MVGILQGIFLDKARNFLVANVTLLAFAAITSGLQLGVCYVMFQETWLPAFAEPFRAAAWVVHLVCNFGLWLLAEYFVTQGVKRAQDPISDFQKQLAGLQTQLGDAATHGKAVAELGRRLQTEGAARAEIWRTEIENYGKQHPEVAKFVAAVVNPQIGKQTRAAEAIQQQLAEAEHLLVAACTTPKALPKPTGPGSTKE